MKPLTKLEAILTFIDFTFFLEIYPESFSRRVPKGYSENVTFPNRGGKLDTNGNFIKWFGWKMHALVDTASGITLSYMITPANVADMDMAEPLVQKLKEDYEEIFKPSYY